MKKIFWIFTAILTCGISLISCSVDDIPAGSDSGGSDNKNIVEESAFSSRMDLSTYAGDNFYQYVLGTWLKNNPVPTEDDDEELGTMDEQDEYAKLALASLIADKKNEIAFDLVVSYSKLNLEDDSTALMKKLNAVDSIQTKDEMAKLIAELAKQGYSAPFIIKPLAMQRKIYPGVGFLSSFDLEEKDIQKMGISAADAKSIIKAGADWKSFIKELESEEKAKQHLGHHDPNAGMKLFNTGNRRTAGADFIKTLATTLDMDLSRIAANKDYEKLFDAVLGKELSDLKPLVKYGILSRDMKYMPFEALSTTKLSDVSKILTKVILACIDNYSGMLTSISHSYVTESIPVEAKAEVTAMFEELRATFRTRIENNSWMSVATKSKAIEKLDAMHLYCGWPENWHTEWEATMPTGKSFYEKMCNLYGQYVDITHKLVGETSEDAIFYADWMSEAATTANAFYSPINNNVIILASNLVAPIYDKNQKDFYNYAVIGATTIGHEITHGFDSNGSKYDDTGKEQNWWAAADLEKFKQKQQLMIEHFNKLEYMPGVFCNGKQTLGENIADLGGLEIAYETYMKKVAATGAERDFLGREFYRAFAEGWRSNRTSKAMEVFLTDEHAAPILRVNGNVCLTNEWYRLFNITNGKMYLTADQRITIW